MWFDAWQYQRLDPVLALLQKIAVLYEKKDTKLKGIMTSLTLVFSDIVLRKTTGLTVEDIQKHFETSVREIETMGETLQNIIGEDGRLVVFIDDLDRCSIDKSLDVLESIKLLFNAKNTTFVIAADIKKLEAAWTLWNSGAINPSDEGREHLDKIFQLKLSLPPKTSFPNEGSNKESNELIQQFLEGYLVGNNNNKLPVEIQRLVVKGFPPNPRKIKRALSLAYFIGKNLKTDVFQDMFPLILIWSVTTLYFHNLADMVKRSPSILIHLCVIIADTQDIGNLQLKTDKIDETRTRYFNNPVLESEYIKKFEKDDEVDSSELIDAYFSSSIIHKIDPAALKFTTKYVVNDTMLYRFLKSIVNYYRIKRNPDHYKDFNHMLKIVIDSAGLIS